MTAQQQCIFPPCTSTSTSPSAPGAAATATSPSPSGGTSRPISTSAPSTRNGTGGSTTRRGATPTSCDTIYFGGGTPSRLDPAAIACIVDRIAADRTIAAGAEITLEANPEDVSTVGCRRVAYSGREPHFPWRPVVRSRRAPLDAPHPHRRPGPRRGRRDPRRRHRGCVARPHLRSAGQSRQASGTTISPPRSRSSRATSRSTGSRSRPGRRSAGGPSGAKSRPWTTTATPPSFSPRTQSSDGRLRALRSLQLRPRRAPRPSQQRVLAAGALSRSGAIRPQRLGPGTAVERSRVGGLCSRGGGGCRPRSRARGLGRRGGRARRALSRSPDRRRDPPSTGSRPTARDRWTADGWAVIDGRPGPPHRGRVAPARRARGPPGALPSRVVSLYISTSCLRRNN